LGREDRTRFDLLTRAVLVAHYALLPVQSCK